MTDVEVIFTKRQFYAIIYPRGDYMNNANIICDNCGAVCGPSSTYCPNCSASFIINDDPFFGEQVIEGVENADVEEFVDYHHKYYTRKFAKVTHKKFFLGINVPALIFGRFWYAFRKMYKVAIIYSITVILLSTALTAILPIVYKDEIYRYYSAQQTYKEYIAGGGESLMKIGNDTAGYASHPAYKYVSHELGSAKRSLRSIYAWMTVPFIIAEIIFRLMANYFYRNHVTKYAGVDNTKGGTSFWSAVLAIGIIDTIMSVIGAILALIPQVRDFALAITGM